MIKIRYLYITILFLMAGRGLLFGQIGGNPDPLNNSTHRYYVPMSDITNNFAWSIYSGTVTSDDIDNGVVTPLPATGYFKFGVTDVDLSGNAFVWITFNGSPDDMPYLGYSGSDGVYTLAYKESTTGTFKCEKSIVYDFILYPPLDVDINDMSNTCQDESGNFLTSLNSRTTRTYPVVLVAPLEDPGYAGTWNFTMNILVKGISGNSATIHSVVIGGTTIETDIGETTYEFNYPVSAGTRTVNVEITYNDVLGVNQEVNVELGYITAQFSERDEDEINKTPGNVEQHIIYAMPDVGIISALN